MDKIRKGDIVQAVKGKDKGKKGKVINIITETKRALVEGINMVKKHKRKTKQEEHGGIVSIEMPISIANIMFFCKSCAKPVRVGFKLTDNKTKNRFCKSCKEVI
ncbi:MAG: 50S ribosomal protein L24 [Candidatus Omnitrophota bacterium]